MANLSERQFRMVTNMKASEGSQGTLFQGGYPRAGAGQPWPRGYSPERRDAVIDAMDHADRAEGFSQYSMRSYMSGSKGRPLQQLVEERNDKHTYPAEERSGREGTAKAVANLARSTVPVEHIRGARYYFQIQDNQINPNTGGHYNPGTPNWGPSITVRASAAHTTTTIHEVGHHVSNLTGTPHAASQRAGVGDQMAAHGQEESFAETYAETHYRDHRGRPLVNFQTSPHKWWGHYGMPGEDVPYEYKDDDPRRSFNRAFYEHQAEHSPSDRARRAYNAKLDMQTRHPTGMVGQIPLLGQEAVEWHEDGNTPKRHEWRDLYPDEREQGVG